MSAADLAESLSEDKVPEAFLAMILIQFGTMVVDRALYLQKTQFGKCLFQVFLVVGTHFWVFFILPGITERYPPPIPCCPWGAPVTLRGSSGITVCSLLGKVPENEG